jgi:FixJ family two-component response regulator
MDQVIHIIDDDASFRTALGRLVETYGFGPVATSRAKISLRLPKSDAGCILLDLHMPGLRGTELQERLASSLPLLPIVFLTGQGTIAASVQAMKAGADDFLEKRSRPKFCERCSSAR